MAVFTRFEGNTRHPQPGVNAGRARAPLMSHVEVSPLQTMYFWTLPS